eukprot:7450554-Pyramimonas_sp.AAC.1
MPPPPSSLRSQVLRADLGECRPLLRDGAWSDLPARPSAADLLKARSRLGRLLGQPLRRERHRDG